MSDGPPLLNTAGGATWVRHADGGLWAGHRHGEKAGTQATHGVKSRGNERRGVMRAFWPGLPGIRENQ